MMFITRVLVNVINLAPEFHVYAWKSRKIPPDVTSKGSVDRTTSTKKTF